MMVILWFQSSLRSKRFQSSRRTRAETLAAQASFDHAGGVALRFWFSPTNACKRVDLDEGFPLGTRAPGNEKSDSAIYDLILTQFPH